MRYKLLFLLCLILMIIAHGVYANDCVSYDTSYILEETSLRGSNLNSKGYIKYGLNLTGLSIDYSDITGTLDVYTTDNSILAGNSVRTSIVLDEGVSLLNDAVAVINAYILQGNQSTLYGGQGTGTYKPP